MRKLAKQLFQIAVTAADPARAVRGYFEENPAAAPAGRIFAIAIGKAAPAMLREALKHLPDEVTALGVTHHENAQVVEGARILTAGHPVPDRAGLEAGQEIIALLGKAGKNDRVFALISGGGSALVPAPLPPLTLEDKQAVNRILLESGLDIGAMNLIRQQLSDLKGGGFLRHAAPAPVTALILSDVIGNDLSAIASGPTMAPLGTREAARLLLQDHGLLEDFPETAQVLLNTGAPEILLPPAENHLIGSNDQSLAAMAEALPEGWSGQIVSDHLTGDVQDAADEIIKAAQNAGAGPVALIFGGETTVKIRGNGRGGRNQELALRVALQAETLPCDWVFMSGGTDGRDGPTDAAGGIVDAGTMGRIATAGQDAEALLANNDSYAALQAAGDLLITGATGTNVADVQVMLLE